MKYSSKTGKLEFQRTDGLVTTLAGARTVAERLHLTEYLEHTLRDFEDKPGKVLWVPLPAGQRVKRLLIAGTAKDKASAIWFRARSRRVRSHP